jgi:hypothetical protein
MSSGRDEWMSKWTEEDKARNLQGVTGKRYEQLEFDFDPDLEPLATQEEVDLWKLKNNTLNHILQAKAIVDVVNESIGQRMGSDDDHEFALWGASELLQKAVDLLE